MKTKHFVITVLAIVTLLSLPLAASASEVWNFWGTQVPFQNASSSSPAVVIPGPYPVSVTNADGFTVKLTPYVSTGVLGVLTGRDQGPLSDERGAGIHSVGTAFSGSTTYEIDGTESLRIDLAPGFSGWEVRFNSLSASEVAHVWAGCVGPGPGCIDLGTVTHIPLAEFESVAIPDADAALPIFITADVADVLVYGVAASTLTSVPTMTEWGMIIFMSFAGLGSVYCLRRRRRI